jgi:hypothetical protein
MRLSALLMALLILAGCAGVRETNADISFIIVHGKMCEDCFDSVALRRGGAIEAGPGAGGVAVSAPKFVADTFRDLPLPVIHWFEHTLDISVPTQVASMHVHFRDGRYENVLVPIDGGASDPALIALGRQVESIALGARYEMLKERHEAIASGLRENTLRFIRLETTPCMGTCIAYSVTFLPNNSARIDARGPHCHVVAGAAIPFSRVRTASYGGANLLPFYPRKWTDSPGSTITFGTAHKQYASDGTDSMVWTAAFREVRGRLDQIVRDTQWSPPLDFTRCGSR